MALNNCLSLDPRKSKSIDRRRETSRYAARDRRGKEADIFTDLKDVVPVVEESTVTHVDRIALLRVASTLCRMRKHAEPFFSKDLMVEDNPNIWNEGTLSECLDGFVILADSDGTMLYITESVSIFLGLTQTDLIGRQIKDFIHPNDYDELMRISTEEAAATEEHRERNDDIQMHKYGHRMIMRMKTVISPRGRNLNLKSALFKAIVCRCRSIQFDTGRIMLIHASTSPAGQGNSICMTNSSVKGSETTSGSFMTRHTCDMRFSYVSENFNFLLKHEPRSLMGTSFYELVHPADLSSVSETMSQLFRKGHCRSPYYRLIGANNSVAWVQTEATTVNHTTRGQKGQYILCVHSLVGMQSEIDSWVTAGNVCTDVLAAGRPVKQYVKVEIDDVAARRKDSYNEVLEWLFRDQPESPPPNATAFREPYSNLGCTTTDRFGSQRTQQQFQPIRQQSTTTNGGYPLESRRPNGMVRMGGSSGTTAAPSATSGQHQQFYLNRKSQMGDFSRSSSIDSNRQQKSSRPRNNTFTATSMDDGNRITNRTSQAAPPTGPRDANYTQSSYRNGNVGIRGDENGSGRSRVSSMSFYEGGVSEQYRNGTGTNTTQFSPLTAGFAEFGVTSPDGVFKNNNSGISQTDQLFISEALTPFTNDAYTDLSAFPTSDEYFMPNPGHGSAQESRKESGANLFSPMSSASHKRHFEEDQAVTVDSLPVVAAPQPISKEFFEEFKQQNPHLFPVLQDESINGMCNNNIQSSSDSFEHLAPFVPEEDIYQLTEPFTLPDGLNFPELDLSEFSYDPLFGKNIQPNPFSQKDLQNMKRMEASNPPLKRARLDSYQNNY